MGKGRVNYFRVILLLLLSGFLLFSVLVYASPFDFQQGSALVPMAAKPGDDHRLKIQVSQPLDRMRVGQEVTVTVSGKYAPLVLKVADGKLSITQINATTFRIKGRAGGQSSLILVDCKGNQIRHQVNIVSNNSLKIDKG